MRVPRIFADLELRTAARVALPPGPSRHLAQVLRLRGGARVILFNGDGRDYQGRIVDLGQQRVSVEVFEAGLDEAACPLRIHLALGISRGERMDFALQKAVELGVSSVTPLFTQRSQVRLAATRLEKRLQHWRGVAIAACEQSGRRRLPAVHPPQSLSSWLTPEQTGALLLDHRSARTLADLPPPTDQLTLLIGPEGGLAEDELSAARQAGLTEIRLGPRILRTETAPLAAIAAIQALWGDFRN